MPTTCFGHSFDNEDYLFISHNVLETRKISGEFAQVLMPNDVVAFMGDLGSGKTTFIAGLCAGLQIEEMVSSPTFTIINEYVGGKIPVYHFDFYRLQNEDDLLGLGFEEYLFNDGICMIEWANKFREYLPESRYDVYMRNLFENDLQTQREIRVVKK